MQVNVTMSPEANHGSGARSRLFKGSTEMPEPSGSRLAIHLATAALLALSCAAAAQKQAVVEAPQAASQRLDGVVVTAKSDPMARSKRRLDEVKKSLPVLGSDTPRKRSATDHIAAYLAAHRDPNGASGEQRRMMERAASPAPAAVPGADPPPSR
jgi:hypothetical protein